MKKFAPVVSVLSLSIAVIGSASALAAVETDNELVVTAQRREEKLSEVPMSISAFGAKDIEQRSITSFTDYASTVPSVAFTNQGGFGSELKIRGIGSGTQALSPTVAVYLGDVPVIHTPRNAGGNYDFRVVDMQRIEVLNGPQGQLYGSNSLGGAVKYVPMKPKTGKFFGHVSIGGAYVQEGEADYDVEAVLNIPLSETLATRLVAYDARMGGYYDNRFAGGPPVGSVLGPLAMILGLSPQQLAYQAPANQKNDVNRTDIHGARLHFNLEASQNLDIEFMLAAERKKWHGANYAEYVPGVTNLDKFQFNDLADTPGKDDMDLANLLINYDLGSAMLTSSTSYTRRSTTSITDFSAFTAFFGNANVLPLQASRFDEPDTFTQEFRLTSQGKGPFKWLAGLFYSKMDQDFSVRLNELTGLDIYTTAFNNLKSLPPGMLPPPAPPTFGPAWTRTNVLGAVDSKYTDKQTAIFGEAKYQVMESLNAAYSFRSFLLQQTGDQTQGGVLFNQLDPSTGIVSPFRSSSSNRERVFTPKYQLTWTPEKGSMYYATAAKGFRTGVVNPPVPAALCQPFLDQLGYSNGVPASKSDTVWNYELGTSLALAQQRVQVSAAVYRTDWKNMQATFYLDKGGAACPFTAIGNVADAQSKGLELKVNAKVTEQLSVDFAGSYNDTKYTTDAPLLSSLVHTVKAGDTVQMSPRYQTNLGMQYAYKLGNIPAFARLDWNYVGEMQAAPTDFPTVANPPTPADPQPVQIGNYNLFNVRLGWELSEHVRLDLYGRNITDRRGVTFANDLAGAMAPVVSYVRPRTLGANLRYDF